MEPGQIFGEKGDRKRLDRADQVDEDSEDQDAWKEFFWTLSQAVEESAPPERLESDPEEAEF